MHSQLRLFELKNTKFKTKHIFLVFFYVFRGGKIKISGKF